MHWELSSLQSRRGPPRRPAMPHDVRGRPWADSSNEPRESALGRPTHPHHHLLRRARNDAGLV